MTSIIDFMTDNHRQCDDFFAAAEEAVSQSDWQEATGHWQQFAEELEQHLQMEELVLFPRFEEATGATSGPTSMMRMEHQQMRSLVQQMGAALTAEDEEEFLGLSETLMVLMQQHNMKEEQVLYPMADQTLAADGSVIESMQALRGRS